MILAQHGYAAAQRIEGGLADGSIDGAIISASNIKPEDVKAKLKALQESSGEADFFIDPEYYANFIDGADKFGKLAKYDYFKQPKLISDLASPKVLQSISKDVLKMQAKWGFKNLISPSIEITSFGSAHESYSLSLLHSSVEYVKDHLGDEYFLYGTILINESAFNDTDRMAQFLDAVTRVKGITGFYVLVDRTASSRPFWDNPHNLAAYMYLVNTLAINKKKVVLGYCDGSSLLGLSVGAKHASIGWWLNSSNFTKQRFIKSGGRRRKQYYSKQLMNLIFVDGELSVLVDKGMGEYVSGTTRYDEEFAQDPLNKEWSDERAILHKWEAISSTAKEVLSTADVNLRLKELESKLNSSVQLYKEAISKLPDGFEVATGSNKLKVWLSAIKLYRAGVV